MKVEDRLLVVDHLVAGHPKVVDHLKVVGHLLALGHPKVVAVRYRRPSSSAKQLHQFELLACL